MMKSNDNKPYQPSFTRRLLNVREVAEKIGHSKSGFDRNRSALESRGFPKPVFGGGKGTTVRWDEVAIDLWLDAQISPDLLKMSAHVTTHQKAAEAYEMTSKLKQRAQELCL